MREFSKKIISRIRGSRVIKLPAKKGPDYLGSVCISYITDPFIYGVDSVLRRGHTNGFEVVAMSEVYRNMGFRVEICEWSDRWYQPPSDCRIAVDINTNLERWALPSGCLKLLHATTSHWAISNAAEYSRITKALERTEIAFKPRRQLQPTNASNIADSVVVLGGEYTINSYVGTKCAVQPIPISSAYYFNILNKKNYNNCKRNFLWLGSYGMIHKGLDLVLEAFEKMPDLNLTICGRPEKEDDFYSYYRKQMFLLFCDLSPILLKV